MRRMCIVFLITVFIVLNGQENKSPGSEIGDAVFRPLGLWDILDLVEHAALYRNSDGRKCWDAQNSMTNSRFEHSVIQATGEGYVVSWQDFETFLNGLWQKGRGYTSSKGKINTNNRKLILQAARSQYGAWYPKFPEDWRWPYVMLSKQEAQTQGDTLYPNGSFRCDGLVEWSYDQIGMGAFDVSEQMNCYFEVEWVNNPPHYEILSIPIFYPAALRRRMVPEQPTPPEVEVVSPEEGEDVEDDIHIEFTADDGEYGSGIDVVYVYVDNELVYRDDEDSDGEKGVEYDYDASGLTEGNHYVKISVYDRAGNLREEEIKVYKGEAPYVVYTYPHSGEDGVMVDLCEMTIVFSDSMDTSSTNSSISIEDCSGENIDIKSFEWSEGNTMVGVKIDTLDYLTEYRVRITDDAMSVDSVRLVRKSLPKNFNMYRIS